MSELATGNRLGPYLLEAIIAEGGFGTVFRATGGPRGTAAVKLLHAELAGSPEALARFSREVDVLGRVRHPGIVEVLDVGRADDGRPWFAMELLAGEDLDTRIARRGRLTPAAALAVLDPVCDALASAHDAGIIHRDIKASNVFLAEDGRVVLLDFGIA
jgi:eukaryotic-like serine/threonine-protein kinase